ncbi:hypothetical protein THAOC_28518, partial [Thalassiosira oceanica]
MLSPEKNSLTQARSPAPTPNSQRRVVKRFRASIPMANYHLPEDEEMEDSLERREQKRVDEAAAKLRRGCQDSSLQRADVRKQSTPPETQPKKVTGAETQASEYLNSFEFPETIPAPSAKTLCLFHDQAVANGSISHQYQLNRAATNLLSLHEVILPSVACETNSALKQEQAIAQRNAKDGLPDSQGTAVVEAIEVCRRAVSKCTIAAMKAGGESFRTRERERETDRVKRHVAAEAQRKADEAEARRNRKEARAKARAERYKAQKGERQRNHPRNKELWQEVTRLMVDIQKLEKEERQWNDALAEVKRMEVNRQPPRKVDLAPPQPTSSSGELLSSIDGAGVGLATSTLVQDVTLAAERVNWTLQRVSAAMVESDRLRAEAFDKYEYDGHKFYGYDAGGDAKGLFMTLSAEKTYDLLGQFLPRIVRIVPAPTRVVSSQGQRRKKIQVEVQPGVAVVAPPDQKLDAAAERIGDEGQNLLLHLHPHLVRHPARPGEVGRDGAASRAGARELVSRAPGRPLGGALNAAVQEPHPVERQGALVLLEQHHAVVEFGKKVPRRRPGVVQSDPAYPPPEPSRVGLDKHVPRHPGVPGPPDDVFRRAAAPRITVPVARHRRRGRQAGPREQYVLRPLARADSVRRRAVDHRHAGRGRRRKEGRARLEQGGVGRVRRRHTVHYPGDSAESGPRHEPPAPEPVLEGTDSYRPAVAREAVDEAVDEPGDPHAVGVLPQGCPPRCRVSSPLSLAAALLTLPGRSRPDSRPGCGARWPANDPATNRLSTTTRRGWVDNGGLWWTAHADDDATGLWEYGYG